MLFDICSEGGHPDRHGGRYEGRHRPGPPDALHLRWGGTALHSREGKLNRRQCFLILSRPDIDLTI